MKGSLWIEGFVTGIFVGLVIAGIAVKFSML
jgi:hypothetical protein